MLELTEADFKENYEMILKQHAVIKGLKTQKKAALDLAQHMSKNNSGSFIDETNHIFDPTQASRRKRTLPRSFFESAKKVISDYYDDLDMYFFARHILGKKTENNDEYLARICISETPIGHYGNTFGSLKDVSERLSSTKDLYTDKEGGRYLLISISDLGQATVAPMHVYKDDHQLSLPTFSTEHFKGGNKTRQIDGFMMEADRYIFTIARDAKKLRIAKLVTHTRMQTYDCLDERVDLIGIRLGGFDPHTLPNAHRIYGYQLRDKDRFEKIRSNITKNGSDRRYLDELQANKEEISTDDNLPEYTKAFSKWLKDVFGIDEIVSKNISDFLFVETPVSGNLNTPDPSKIK